MGQQNAGDFYALSTKRAHSVTLLCLPLCGLVAVVPKPFHFAIIPPTVDCGISRREEISQTDLL